MKDSSEEQESDQGSVKSSSDELQPFSPGSKIKVMCSYGGRILPRPHDGQLRYVGGETRIMFWNRRISFSGMVSKLLNLVKSKNAMIKYQLPNEDLDALISVLSEDDFNNMLDEYENMENRDGCNRLRLFLFPQIPSQQNQQQKQQSDDASGTKNIDQQFIEAVNHEKPTPTKMHRQLSLSDRSNSSNFMELGTGSHRGSPRMSLYQQQVLYSPEHPLRVPAGVQYPPPEHHLGVPAGVQYPPPEHHLGVPAVVHQPCGCTGRAPDCSRNVISPSRFHELHSSDLRPVQHANSDNHHHPLLHQTSAAMSHYHQVQQHHLRVAAEKPGAARLQLQLQRGMIS